VRETWGCYTCLSCTTTAAKHDQGLRISPPHLLATCEMPLRNSSSPIAPAWSILNQRRGLVRGRSPIILYLRSRLLRTLSHRSFHYSSLSRQGSQRTVTVPPRACPVCVPIIIQIEPRRTASSRSTTDPDQDQHRRCFASLRFTLLAHAPREPHSLSIRHLPGPRTERLRLRRRLRQRL
jgi:hypothetical protein